MDYSETQRRISIIGILGGIALVTYIGRLYQKTVLEYGQTVQAAESQYAYRKEVDGLRGDIVVRSSDGTYFPLATNERRYQVVVIPNHVTGPEETANKLASILAISQDEIFEKINNKKFYIPPIKRRLDRITADRVASQKLNGVILQPELIRTYPEGPLASQVVGFVNFDGQGNYGIEGGYDDVLRGESGYQIGEKDNQDRPITLSDEVKAKPGATIILTLNRQIQFITEKFLQTAVEEFKTDEGTIIIVNTKTGQIVAMATKPDFNPNEFNTVKTEEQSRYNNAAIASVWEPGSIMKSIIMALALDKKLVEPDTKQEFGASVRVLNHTIYTAEKKAFGLETMTQVLENSDNVGMVWVSDKLGNESLYEGLKHFGFGESSKIDIKNSAGGSLPPIKQWNDLTRATISFGQGISVTPLQMVMAYAALANKGVEMQPYLVDEVFDDRGTLIKTEPKEVGRIVSEEASSKISVMLESVVQHGHGKRAGVDGYRIAGKTGTAQVAKPEGGYYDDRHIGSFVGYFPVSEPRYAMIVVLKNPKGVEFAESSAAPVFGKIAQWILSAEQVKPDKQP